MVKVQKFLLLILVAFLFTGCILKKPRAGIEVKSTPAGSTVFLNDKEVGKTPFKDSSLAPGEYNVKIQNGESSWSQKVRLLQNTVVYINRELAANPEDASGEIISLERGKGITIITAPTQVAISLDNQKQGNSPYLVPNVTAGDHEVLLEKEGYLTKKIKVKAIEDYKIVIEAQLKKIESNTTSPSPTPSASVAPSASPTASASASPRTSPSPSGRATATPRASGSPRPSATTKADGEQTVTILSTPTGWLRVREKPSTSAAEVGRVNTGEQYPYEERLDSGWTLIVLSDGTKGYVSSRYVKVN